MFFVIKMLHLVEVDFYINNTKKLHFALKFCIFVWF